VSLLSPRARAHSCSPRVSLARSLRATLAGALLVGAACVSTTDPAPPAERAPPEPSPASVPFSTEPTVRSLAILHAADLESAILVGSAAREAGGIARATTVVRALAASSRAPVTVLAAGDTFLPAPELKVDVDGVNAVLGASHLFGFRATALGNHEFDLGEGFLADMIAKSRFAYVASTIDIDAGPLAPLVLPSDDGAPFVERAAGRIVRRARQCAGGELVDEAGATSCTGTVIGLVGAVTPSLRQISNLPDHLHVRDSLPEVVAAVQREVDALTSEGVDLVVLLSHLQGVHHELELVQLGLTGVDVIVAGGGDNRLADPSHRLLGGHGPDELCAAASPSCYPLLRRARDGAPVAIVATDGQLLYVGQLTVGFDARGVLTHVDTSASRPWPTDARAHLELRADLAADGLAHEARVAEALAPLMKPIATTAVFLDGIRESVRNRETNLGDLSADALLFAAHANGAPDVAIALRNGGGIRAPIGSVDPDTHARTGTTIRALDVQTSFRFDNGLVVVDVSHGELRRALESALRQAGTTRGHFPQVSADVELRFVDGPDQEHVLTDGKITGITCPGGRVESLRIPTSKGPLTVVENGRVLNPDARVQIVTLDYLSKGGDGWFPLTDTRARPLTDAAGAPLTEQRAFTEYVGALSREGTWDDGRRYPEIARGAERRIVSRGARAAGSLVEGCVSAAR